MRSLNRRSYLLFLPVLLVLLDQITKIWARSVLREKDGIVLINGVLEFRYLENRGAAWGMFQGRYSVLSFVTIVLLVLFVLVLIRIPEGRKYFPLYMITLFIIAGAIGNLIDRIVFGYVTDFIYFSLINFPIFNVADIYVTCSVFILVFLFLFYYSEEELSFLPFFGKKKSEEEPKETDDNSDESAS